MGTHYSKKNRVRVGQLWQKKDTGIIVEILNKGKSPYFNTKRVNRNKKNGSHSITTYDLTKHYTLIN